MDEIEIDASFNVNIGKIYLLICCDWIGHPLHSLVHILCIILILMLFHVLFTFTKNIILNHIWSYHSRYCVDEEDDIYSKTMHINEQYLNKVQIERNVEKRMDKVDVNMDKVEES